MITIKDVAITANVSIATVSNYINNTKPVSSKTSQRIREAIEKLDFTPNIFAKSLKSNIYNDVGVILPSLNNSYYSQIYQGIEHEFKNSKHFLNLAFSYDIPDIERSIVNNFLKKNICGLIVVTCLPSDWHLYYNHFISKNRSLVLIDRMINNLDCNFVAFDNWRTIRDLVKHLIGENKRKIYLFSGPKFFYCENQCIEGYLDAFKQADMEADPNNIIDDALNKEKAFKQTINLLKNACPDVIIATSELSAMGIMEAIILLGYQNKIPIITLGEQHWNKFTHTCAAFSIVRPAIHMGKTAASLLKKQIQSPKTHEKSTIILVDKTPDFAHIHINNKDTTVKKPLKKEINILFLETLQTSVICSFLSHFENSTNIRANVEVLPHRLLFDRILSEAANEAKQSDVYMFDIPWLYYLASSGILADITAYINDSSFDKSIFLPDCLKYFSEFEDRYYGLPFMYAPQIFFYRKDFFESHSLRSKYEQLYNSKLVPPRTWQEFIAIAEFFTNNVPSDIVKYGTSIPAAYKECMVPEIYMRLYSYGGRIFDQQFNVVFDSPQTLKTYVNFKSTLKFAKPNYKTTTDISAVSDFINGEVAMLITYPSFITNIMDMRATSLIGDIGYSLIPGRTPILGGWSLGINSRSDKKDEALKFISWTATKDNANYFTLFGGQPAIDSIFTNDELISLYPYLPLYQSAYKYTVPIIPPYKKGRQIIPQDKIDSIIYEYAIQLIDGQLDVSSTIMQSHEELSALFKRYNY